MAATRGVEIGRSGLGLKPVLDVDRGQVVGALAAAFHADPLLDWFIRSDERRDPAVLSFFRFYLSVVARPRGYAQVAPDGGGAAIWRRSEDVLPDPVRQQVRALPTLLAVTGAWRFGRLLAVRSAQEAHRPKLPPHDHLVFIGVVPGRQRAGLGGTLLGAQVDRLDRQRRPAFLETANPASLPFFLRHGFAVSGDYRAGRGAPTVWTLWREPGSASGAAPDDRFTAAA